MIDLQQLALLPLACLARIFPTSSSAEHLAPRGWLSQLGAWGSRSRHGKAGAARRGVRRRQSRFIPANRQAEMLEARLAMTIDGVVWGSDPRLTMSFVADGTTVLNQASNLEAKFNAVGAKAEWQAAIVKAFQTWASQTNGDIGVVADSGDPLGIAGSTSHDPRFGDIRVAAVPLPSPVMALSIPSTAVSGTWVGDLLFNSSANFDSIDEVFAVALHEAGNILGLKDSDDPNSPMATGQIPVGRQPTAADLNALQLLHGKRIADLYDLTGKGNNSIAEATQLHDSPQDGFNGSVPLVLHGDITTAADVDVFRFDGPVGYAGGATVRLRTQGLSSLQAKVTITNRDGDVLATQSATKPGEDLQVLLPEVIADEKYYVQVSATGSAEAAIGGYALAMSLDARLESTPEQIQQFTDGRWRELPQQTILQLTLATQEPVYLDDDEGANETGHAATALKTREGFVEFTRYQVDASISASNDVDYYRLRTPKVDGGRPLVLTIRTHDSLLPADAELELSLFDDREVRLPLEVVARGDGEGHYQLSGVPTDAELLLRVVAVHGGTGGATGPLGNYAVDVTLGNEAVRLVDLARGTLTPDAVAQRHTLTIRRPQMLHLVAAADATVDGQRLNVSLLGEGAQPLRQIPLVTDDVRSAQAILLLPGNYELVVGPTTPLTTSVQYTVRAAVGSDPLLVDPGDPTENPVVDCPQIEGQFCLPGDTDVDQDVDWDDFQTLVNNFGWVVPGWYLGDFDRDGWVTMQDFRLLTENFGTNTDLPRNQVSLGDVSSNLPSPFNAPPSGLLGDFDGDLDVDSVDLLSVIGNWTGASPSGELRRLVEGDIDADGDIDSADLLGLVSNWTGSRS